VDSNPSSIIEEKRRRRMSNHSKNANNKNVLTSANANNKCPINEWKEDHEVLKT
jgi:hypothetical protein